METTQADRIKELDIILDKGVDFSVTVNKKNILHKIKVLPETVVFNIRPLKLGALLKISKIINETGIVDLNETESIYSAGLRTAEHIESIAKVVAYAVTNEKKEPPKRLINFFIDNLTAGELGKIMALVVTQMDLSRFLVAIVSMKGINLMKPEVIETKNKPSGIQSEE